MKTKEKSKARAGAVKVPARSSASMVVAAKRRDAVIVVRRTSRAAEQIPGYYLG